jgi:hypothetical protein
MIQLTDDQQTFYDKDSQVKIWASTVRRIGQSFLAAYTAITSPGDWIILSKDHLATLDFVAAICKDYELDTYKNYVIVHFMYDGIEKSVTLSSYNLLENTPMISVIRHFILDDFESRGGFDPMPVKNGLGDYRLQVLSKALPVNFNPC